MHRLWLSTVLGRSIVDSILKEVQHPFRSLETLNCVVQDSSFTALVPYLIKLHFLIIDVTIPTRICFAEISQISGLRTLQIAGSASLDIQNIGLLLERCQGLELLTIDKVYSLYGGSAGSYSDTIEQTTDYFLEDTDILEFEQPATRLHTLQFLVHSNLTIQGLRVLGLRCPSLKVCILSWISSIDLERLGSDGPPAFPCLERLSAPAREARHLDSAMSDILSVVNHHMPRLRHIYTGAPDFNREMNENLASRQNER